MSDHNKPKRAKTLDDLLTNEYGVNTHPGPETAVVAVQTTATKLCSNNPNRLALAFFNLGSNDIFIYLDNSVSASKGILVGGGGGSVAFNWRDDMTLISNEWFALANGGATNLQVVEVVTQ